jgi:hypothetical protein
LLTGGLKSSRFASIHASRFTGGWTFVAPGVSDDGDGERVDVSMIERISCRAHRQLSRPPLPVAVILSLSKDLSIYSSVTTLKEGKELEILRLRSG